MSTRINYHHLYYFMRIAEDGGISKAAQKLRLGQPTLSEQLRQFEEAIGVRLFDRRHKRLVLNEHGAIALEYARTIFRTGDEMVEALNDRLKPLKPSLHIGSIDSISKQVISRVVKTALKISPCQITLSEGRPDELLRELCAHRIDLMITNFLPLGGNSAGVTSRSIARSPVSFYGAPHFKKMARGFPGSLSGKPVILPTFDSKMRHDLEHWAKLNDVELNLLIESQDIAMKKLLAIQGVGLIPSAAHSVKTQVARGDLVKLGTPSGVEEQVFLLTAQRKIKNPIASAIMRLSIES